MLFMLLLSLLPFHQSCLLSDTISFYLFYLLISTLISPFLLSVPLLLQLLPLFFIVLITIQKVFIRIYLNYRDINYSTKSWNPRLDITGAIRGISKEKLYQELSLDSLQLQCWYIKLGNFCKICKSKSPQYLCKLITEKAFSNVTRNAESIPLFNIKRNFLKNFCFLSTMIEWKKLNSNF